MNKKFFLALSLALSLMTIGSSAFAALHVSLLTVSPGPEIFDAFGHSAIAIYDSKSKETTVYEYSGIQPYNFISKTPVQQSIAIFGGKISAPVSASPLKVFKARYAGGPLRELTTDPLNLNQKQAKKLEELLQKDVQTGSYEYEHFKRNCATKVRNAIFSVLEKKNREAFNGQTDRTYAQLLKNAINENIQINQELREKYKSDKTYNKVEFPLRRFMKTQSVYSYVKNILENYKIGTEYYTGDDLLASMSGIEGFAKFFSNPTNLDTTLKLMEIARKNPIPDADKQRFREDLSHSGELHTILSQLIQKEMNRELSDYETLFIPTWLRTNLLRADSGTMPLLNILKTKVEKLGN